LKKRAKRKKKNGARKKPPEAKKKKTKKPRRPADPFKNRRGKKNNLERVWAKKKSDPRPVGHQDVGGRPSFD